MYYIEVIVINYYDNIIKALCRRLMPCLCDYTKLPGTGMLYMAPNTAVSTISTVVLDIQSKSTRFFTLCASYQVEAPPFGGKFASTLPGSRKQYPGTWILVSGYPLNAPRVPGTRYAGR